MQNSLVRRTVAQVGAISAAVSVAVMPFAAKAVGSALGNIANSANQTANSAGVTTTKSLPELVGSFIGAALGLLGVVLVVLVIYAGFLWMTAQGSEDKVKTAKKILTSAVIGMIIIFAAYAITNFVVTNLTTAVG